jgi:hypothetical protein
MGSRSPKESKNGLLNVDSVDSVDTLTLGFLRKYINYLSVNAKALTLDVSTPRGDKSRHRWRRCRKAK